MERLICETRAVGSFSEAMAALQDAADAHAHLLNIGKDRMYDDFCALWMLARCRLYLRRLPLAAPRVETFLRRPTPVMSLRDFNLYDGDERVGTAVQSWVLANAQTRKLIDMRKVPPLWEIRTPTPERTEQLRHIALPKQTEIVGTWTVSEAEIDSNGHCNNAQYMRQAERFAPPDCNTAEIIYERECFLVQTLELTGAFSDGAYFLRGMRADEESFRVRFYTAAEPNL